jgi:hypothetical protein
MRKGNPTIRHDLSDMRLFERPTLQLHRNTVLLIPFAVHLESNTYRIRPFESGEKGQLYA